LQRFFISILALIVLAALATSFYFYQAGVLLPSGQHVASSRGQLLSAEFEEQLVYFLVTKLNIFEGNFEVIDVVNLDVRNFTGSDYVLITLRAPDGRLCQVTAKRQAGRSAQWQFDDKSFSVIGLAKYEPASIEEDYDLISDLSARLGKEIPFKDQTLSLFKIVSQDNSEFLVFESLPPKLTVSINKDKKIGLSNQMSAGEGPDALWKPDYPTSYLGPGYRSYLYEKVKGRK